MKYKYVLKFTNCEIVLTLLKVDSSLPQAYSSSSGAAANNRRNSTSSQSSEAGDEASFSWYDPTAYQGHLSNVVCRFAQLRNKIEQSNQGIKQKIEKSNRAIVWRVYFLFSCSL